jgi:hypothetical protein
MSALPIRWEAEICDAIDRLVEIEFTIPGHSGNLYPYILYVTRDGDRLLRGISFGHSGWVTLEADSIQKLTLTTHKFYPDPAFDRHDPAYFDVRCMV